MLDRFLKPASVAIIGASRKEHGGGGMFLKGLLDGGYSGRLYPVNPRETEIFGLPCYHSVTDIPEPVELAYIAVSARTVPAVLTECGAKGIPFAIIHTAGFSEIGEDGLEAEVVRIAREGNIRFIGPNCMGFFSPEIGFNTVVTHVPISRQPGRTAFIGQSGWVTKNLLLMGDNRGLRFKHVVNIGNQSDLSLEDFLEYFTDNTGTDVIGFYIEGVKRGRDFLRLAKQASRKKPVIVWKGGLTGAGVPCASSMANNSAARPAIQATANIRRYITVIAPTTKANQSRFCACIKTGESGQSR